MSGFENMSSSKINTQSYNIYICCPVSLNDFEKCSHTYETKYFQTITSCFSKFFFSIQQTNNSQINGLTMGTSWSSFLAVIFMNHLGKKFLINNRFSHKFIFVYRYVDDGILQISLSHFLRLIFSLIM